MNYDDWVAERLPLVTEAPGSVQWYEPSRPDGFWRRWAFWILVAAIVSAVIGGAVSLVNLAASHARAHAGHTVTGDSYCGTGTDHPCLMGGGGGDAVFQPEPMVPSEEEILRMVEILANKKVKKALEELGEGSCLRHVGNLGG